MCFCVFKRLNGLVGGFPFRGHSWGQPFCVAVRATWGSCLEGATAVSWAEYLLLFERPSSGDQPVVAKPQLFSCFAVCFHRMSPLPLNLGCSWNIYFPVSHLKGKAQCFQLKVSAQVRFHGCLWTWGVVCNGGGSRSARGERRNSLNCKRAEICFLWRFTAFKFFNSSRHLNKKPILP